jgi:hypothetical protein
VRKPPRYPVRKHVRWETYDQHCVFDYPLLNDLRDLKNGTSATVVRSTTGLFDDSLTGLLTEAAVNSPRRQGGGLLLETSDTNYVLNSADLSGWFNVNQPAPELDLTIINPTGSAGAWKVQSDVTDDINYTALSIEPSTALTASVYVKAGNFNKITLITAELPAGTPTAINEYTIPEDGRWHRISVTSELPANMIGFLVGEGLSPTVNVGDYCYVWHPSFASSNFLQSPIDVGETAVTRTGELVNLDLDDTLPARGSDFAISGTYQLLSTPSASANLMGVNGETNGRLVNLTTDRKIQAFYGGNNTIGDTVLTVGTKYRILFTGNSTHFKVYIDGVLEFTTAIGGSGSGSQTSIGINTNLNGSFIVSKVRGYNKYFDTPALAAAEACLG